MKMGIEKLQKVKGLEKPSTQSFKQAQLQRLKEKTQARQAEEARIQLLKQEASKIDAQIKSNNFLGSISNYETQYKAIPEEIRKFMAYDLNAAKNELQNRIKEVERQYQQAKDSENKYDDRNDRVREKQYRAEAQAYQEALNKLKSGQFLSLSDVNRYANDSGNYARQKERARQERKKQTSALLKAGEITSINYSTGKVVVSGQTVRVSPAEAKKLELSSVKRAKVQNVINKAADPSKVLTVSDFQLAREFGISSSDLLKVNIEASKALSKKKQEVQLTKTELNRLQSLPKSEINKIQNVNKAFPFLSQKLKTDVTQIPKTTISKVSKSADPLAQLKQVTLTFTPEEKLFNKLNTGQTITPTEQKQLVKIAEKKGADLTKQQVTLLKNAPKDIGVGLYEVGKEIVVLGKDAVVGSYNYGKNLVVRFDNGENNPLFNDIKKIATGTVDVGKFIVNNPKKSLAIAGLAASSAGSDYSKAFSNNPVKTLTKTAAYLFPGTIIKGGVKTVGLGTKGVTSAVQAKRLSQLEKQVSTLRKAIPLRQNNKLDKLIGSLSKVSKASTRNSKLNSFVNAAAKEQGIKLKKGTNLAKKVSELKTKTKVIPAGKIKGAKAAPIPKAQPKRPIKIFDIEKGTVRSVSKLPTPKPKRLRDTTKYFKVEDGKISKVTKGEFKKIEPQIVSKAQPKRPIKLIDLQQNKVTKVSAGSPKLQSKSIFKSKKGQARIFRGSPAQIQQQVSSEVTKVAKKVKTLKKLKKKPSASTLSKIKKELNALKKFANSANLNKIGRFAAIIKAIESVVKDVSGLEKLPAKAPKKTPAKKQPQKKTPAKKQPQKKTPAKAQPQKKGSAQKSPTKPKPTQITKTKTIKKVPKKPVKKIPKKEIPKIKIPKFGESLPAGFNLAANIRIAGKTYAVRLPVNKALKRATTIVLRDKKLKRFDLISVGVTQTSDIKRPKALERFKGTKGDRVYTYVQK